VLLDYREYSPKVGHPVFLAPGCQVIGQVTLEDYVSIWFNAVLRADHDRIVVGWGSNLQDNVVVHVDRGRPCLIGREVVVGHGAILHGCRVDDRVLVGMGAILLSGAHIGEGSIVAAGSLVPEGREVPPRSLVMGSPARVVRTVSDEEVAGIVEGAARYRELWAEAGWHFR
jgi:carbonic anhydrase/acetyltransferase-like protein (isoleucine patch superfamily)